MFESKLLSVKPLVAEIPVRLPLSILLALPDYVTSDVGAQLFNLPAAIGRLIAASAPS